ncbi:CLUMA_CG009080, isoform A [Clunio marinus]|uniref:CLUMA_CG009080, isoform A n=1 Tax=Clunio marinus TaxID=568069 RepID=A0A1J1I9H3_9DIPT|nr:CLUMA_CG009080, isoform A [Clunio marinus]
MDHEPFQKRKSHPSSGLEVDLWQPIFKSILKKLKDFSKCHDVEVQNHTIKCDRLSPMKPKEGGISKQHE